MGSPRDIEHTFAGAGEIRHQLAGRYIRVLSATGDVFVKPGGGSEVRRKSGQALYLANGFNEVTLRSTIAQTVQVVIADEPQDDNAQTVTANVTATVAAGNTVTTTADASVAATTTAQVLAGRADRLTAIIKNLAANAAPIRVGDAGTAAAQGHELAPGESIALDTTSAIYVYNSHGSAQSVSLTEVRAV